MVVCLSRHRAHDLVKDFFAVPYEKWSGPPRFWKLLPAFLFELKTYLGWKLTFGPEKCDEFHRFFAYRNIQYFNHEPFADYCEIQLQSATKRPAVALRPMEYYEPETIRAMRSVLYERLRCSTFAELIQISPRAVKRSNHLFASVSAFLGSPDCDIDAYADGLLFSLELFLVEKPPIPSFPFTHLLAQIPFRAVAAEFAAFFDPSTNHIQSLAPERVCLESEMNRVLLLAIRSGQRIWFPVQPLSPMSLAVAAKILPQTFDLCLRHNLIPPFQRDHETELINQIAKFGISPFTLNTMEKWLRGGDLLPVLNSLLTYAAHNGTYYIQMVASLIRSAMRRYPTVTPVVEAFILTLDNTPLKKALAAEFTAAQATS
jgi:hypothetical protein